MTVHGIPRRFQTLSIETFPGDPQAKQKVLAYADDLEERRKVGSGLVLYGKHGLGKTSLACYILKKAMLEGYVAHFSHFTELITFHTETWRDVETREDYKYCILESDFLVIDDIGTEIGSGQKLPSGVLDFVLRKRYGEGRCTILTTNVEPKDFRDTYSPAVASLMNRSCVSLLVNGKDLGRRKTW